MERPRPKKAPAKLGRTVSEQIDYRLAKQRADLERRRSPWARVTGR